MAPRSLARLVAAWAACGLAAGCAAAPGPVETSCPATIKTTQQLAGTATPWTATQLGTSNRLVYSELYDGPPQDGQGLMPDATEDGPGKTATSVWRFHGAPAKQGTWLLCGYQNTQVKLSLRLPETVTECRQVDSTDPNRVVKLVSQVCR